MKRIGAATALEVRATGINYAFAPCIAVYIYIYGVSITESFRGINSFCWELINPMNLVNLHAW